jgi:hypothetical protein
LLPATAVASCGAEPTTELLVLCDADDWLESVAVEDVCEEAEAVPVCEISAAIPTVAATAPAATADVMIVARRR